MVSVYRWCYSPRFSVEGNVFITPRSRQTSELSGQSARPDPAALPWHRKASDLRWWLLDAGTGLL